MLVSQHNLLSTALMLVSQHMCHAEVADGHCRKPCTASAAQRLRCLHCHGGRAAFDGRSALGSAHCGYGCCPHEQSHHSLQFLCLNVRLLVSTLYLQPFKNKSTDPCTPKQHICLGCCPGPWLYAGVQHATPAYSCVHTPTHHQTAACQLCSIAGHHSCRIANAGVLYVVIQSHSLCRLHPGTKRQAA